MTTPKKLLSATKRIKSLVDSLERADSPAEILALCARITWQLRRICNLSK